MSFIPFLVSNSFFSSNDVTSCILFFWHAFYSINNPVNFFEYNDKKKWLINILSCDNRARSYSLFVWHEEGKYLTNVMIINKEKEWSSSRSISYLTFIVLFFRRAFLKDFLPGWRATFFFFFFSFALNGYRRCPFIK